MKINENQIERFARELIRLREEYDFSTFWLGTSVPGPIEAEDAIALKRRINRAVSERALDLGLQAEPDAVAPEARIIIQWPEGGALIQPEPLLVYGRYLKLSREIPQSRWPCRMCYGKGCPSCGGTGKRYMTSVEEIVGAPLLALTGAASTKMHSVGREDVDARMLGSGRPFILQLASPRKRTVDLASIQQQVNHENENVTAVSELQFVKKSLLEKLVRLEPDKSYRAEVKCLVPARRELVETLAKISNLRLDQETPRRVLHRRPNRLRHRVVKSCAVEIPDHGDMVTRFFISLRVQSGTYIKEFISGDEGRTRPCITNLLHVPCDCAALDVLEIHCNPLTD